MTSPDKAIDPMDAHIEKVRATLFPLIGAAMMEDLAGTLAEMVGEAYVMGSRDGLQIAVDAVDAYPDRAVLREKLVLAAHELENEPLTEEEKHGDHDGD